jgi:hypothetical protein
MQESKTNFIIHYRNDFLNYLDSDDLLVVLVSRYDKLLENCCYVYLGDEIEDIKHISKLNLNSPCFVFSEDTFFLCNSRLYYSVFPYLMEGLKEKDIKYY